MMNPTNAAVLTAVVVTTGRWSEGKTLDSRVVVGGVFLVVGFSVMGEISPELASSFAVLTLVAAALRYTLPIVKKSGFTK